MGLLVIILSIVQFHHVANAIFITKTPTLNPTESPSTMNPTESPSTTPTRTPRPTVNSKKSTAAPTMSPTTSEPATGGGKKDGNGKKRKGALLTNKGYKKAVKGFRSKKGKGGIDSKKGTLVIVPSKKGELVTGDQP